MSPLQRALVLALAVAAALAPLACRTKNAPATSTSASASARPKPPPRVPSSAPAPKPAPIGCRVLTVKGEAPGAPKAGALLDGTAFFELPAGAELALRHSETTRELALKGPGRFRACPKGEELVAVTRGKVRTTSGPGARAGAEVRLATPFGVVHFGDAALELDVGEKQAEVRVTQGAVAIDGRTEADGGPPTKPVSGPQGRATFRGPTDPIALEAECAKSATLAEPSPRPAPSASGNALGQWAVERLKARQATRYLCTRAMAAAGLDGGPGGDRLWDQAAARILAKRNGGPDPEIQEK